MKKTIKITHNKRGRRFKKELLLIKSLLPKDDHGNFIIAPFYFVLLKITLSVWLAELLLDPDADRVVFNYLALPIIYLIFFNEWFKTILVVNALEKPDLFQQTNVPSKEHLQMLFNAYSNSFYHELSSIGFASLFAMLFVNGYALTSIFVGVYFLFLWIDFYPRLKKVLYT